VKGAAFALLILIATVSFRFGSPYLLSDLLRFSATVACALSAWLLARSPAVRTWGAGAWRLLERHARTTVLVLAIAVFAFSATLGRWVLDPWPHISDEVSYWFQARAFAAGQLSLAAPEPGLEPFFPAEWVVTHQGRWFSVLPPGFALLLAVGLRLGAPSVVNPAIGAAAIVVIHRLVLRLAGQTKALAAVLLCALSPFFLFMCGSFMSHPASLLFTALALLLFLEGTFTDKRAPFVLSGLCSGFAFLIRPLDATALWVAAAGYLLLRHRTRRQLLGTCLSAAGLVAGAAIYAAYNHALAGRWLVSLVSLTSPRNHMGFGEGVGLPWSGFSTPGHTPWRAALNLNFNAAVLSADLFGWPVSSLWPIFGLACFGRLQWPHRVAAISALAVVIAYAFYWYHGVCFGARFYFSTLPALLLLTVEGLSQAPDWIAARLHGALTGARAATAAFVAACFAFSALLYVPTVSLFEPYHNQWNIDRGLADFVATRAIDRGIVFVGPEGGNFGRALLWNAPVPGAGDVIYAFENGPLDDELVRRFPGRPVFHYVQGDAARRWPPWLKRLLRTGYAIDLLRAAARPFLHRGAAPTPGPSQ
jgi:hypothetical protein